MRKPSIKRELKICFHSMIGYVFIAFLVAYTGIYFLAYNLELWISVLFLCIVRDSVRMPGSNSDPDDALLCRR